MAKNKTSSTAPAAAEPVAPAAQSAPKKASKAIPVTAKRSAKAAKSATAKLKGKAGKGAVTAGKAADKSIAAKSVKKVPGSKRDATSPNIVSAKKAGKKKESKKLAPKDGEEGTAEVLDSQVAYEGPLFRVVRDHIIEPGGSESHRDVIRHNGSVVVLAVDHGKPKHGKPKKNPWIVMERQYRYAAGQYLWELPAGKLEKGEQPVEGAKRELAEETGYAAEKWSSLVEYFASPGFLGESMKVFLAEGLIAGDAHPEEDEKIDFRLVKLSDVLDLIDEGKIIDGKTLCAALLYARILGVKRKK